MNVRRFLLSCCWLVAAALPVATASAQDPPLYEQEPYDLIHLTEQNQNAVVKVLPIPFPGRQVPESPKSTDLLRVKLVSAPSELYEIAWKDIERIDLFEVVLLNRAIELTRASDFDQAYDFFSALLKRYANVRGLQPALNEFLFRNAGDAFQKGRHGEALGMLEELYRRDANFAMGTNTVVAASNLIAGQVVDSYMKKGDLQSAQTILSRLGRVYGEDKLASVVGWRMQLDQMAAAKRDEATAHMEAGRLREAHQSVRKMLEIWPDVQGGKQLAGEVERRYPLVVVAVSQLASQHDPTLPDNWSARRTGRLRHRLFMEIQGPGPEGGQYFSPYGTSAQSDDRRQLTIQVNRGEEAAAASLTGFQVADRLLSMASPTSPQYDETWGGLMSRVSVDNIFQVQVDLRRPYVLPEAHLQVHLDPAVAARKETEPSTGGYVVAERTPEMVRFLRAPDYSLGTSTQPAEVTELYFEDPNEAINALQRGEVDVVDRVLPWDAERLRDNPKIRIGRYALPTIHVLIPNHKNPFLANATFRRAVAYGMDRDGILKQLILGGQEVEGCEVVSGPFPKGIGDEDPLAYAYDTQIEPRKFNPRLAATLTRIADHELKELAKTKETKPPELKPLVIGHPAEFLPRLACEAIAKQLNAVGIECSIKALPPGETRDSTGTMDLVYTKLAVWEPIRDARRILATTGLAANQNPYVDLACRRLDTSTNWKEAAQRLHDLHFIAHNEVIVLPLWQIVDHFAYHPRVTRIGRAPVSLYHEIEQWQVAPHIQ